MDWIWITAIIAWIVVGTFSLGVSGWIKDIKNDWIDVTFAYIIWLIIWPIVIIYKVGVLARSLA